MKKIIWAFVLVFLIVFALIAVYIAQTWYSPPLLKEFNTLYAKDFNVSIWETQVNRGMTQSEVKALIGEPLRIDNSRCDFYTKPRTKWLKFKEYKVCYDENHKFFLKLKFEYGIVPLFNESY